MAQVNEKRFKEANLVEQSNYDTAISVGTSYADGLVFDCKDIRESVISIHNTHATQNILYRIYGSAEFSDTSPSSTDPTLATSSWMEIKAETTLTAAAKKTYESFSNTWSWILVQVKGSGATTTGQLFHRGEN